MRRTAVFFLMFGSMQLFAQEGLESLNRLSEIILINQSQQFIPQTRFEILEYYRSNGDMQFEELLDSIEFFVWKETDQDFEKRRVSKRFYDSNNELIHIQKDSIINNEFTTVEEEIYIREADSLVKFTTKFGELSEKIVWQLDNNNPKKETKYFFENDLWNIQSKIIRNYFPNGQMQSTYYLDMNLDTIEEVLYLLNPYLQREIRLSPTDTILNLLNNPNSGVLSLRNLEDKTEVFGNLNSGGGEITFNTYEVIGEWKILIPYAKLEVSFNPVNNLKEITYLETNNNGITYQPVWKKIFYWQFTTAPIISYQEKIAKVFPNPVKNLLYFQGINKEELYNCKVQIIDGNGRCVLLETLQSSLDISELPPGIYFYKIYKKNELFQSGKVVKM